MHGLRTGQVAKQTGVNVETLRYYERQGLIDAPPRTASGYREYPAETVSRIRFIRRAKALGFTLQEIGDLLSLRGQGHDPHEDEEQPGSPSFPVMPGLSH